MITTFTLTRFHSVLLTEQINVVTILTVTIFFFLVLLILGIVKSYKLKSENDELSKPKLSTEDDNKVYRDFREGHLYDNY